MDYRTAYKKAQDKNPGLGRLQAFDLVAVLTDEDLANGYRKAIANADIAMRNVFSTAITFRRNGISPTRTIEADGKFQEVAYEAGV